MSDQQEYDSADGGMVIATMMIVSIVSVVIGCLATLGVQWLMCAFGG